MSIIGISGKIGSGKDTVARIIQFLNMQDRHGYNSTSYEDAMKLDDHIIYSNSDWKIARFAGALKRTVANWLGVSVLTLEDREYKNTPLGKEWVKYHLVNSGDGKYFSSPEELRAYYNNTFQPSSLIKREELTPRKLMQLLGTEAGRQIIHPNIWVNVLFAQYNMPLEPTEDEALRGYKPNLLIPDVRFPNEAQAIKDRGGMLIKVSRIAETTPEIANHPSETGLDNWEDWDHVIDNNGTINELGDKVKEIFK